MKYRRALRIDSIVYTVCALYGVVCSAAASPPQEITKMVGVWRVDCFSNGCLIFDYGTAALPATVYVNVDSVTKKPKRFGFETDSDIDASAGVTVIFLKTVVDSRAPQCAGGPDTPKPASCYNIKSAGTGFNLPFTYCDKNFCAARTSGQFIPGEQTQNDIDLLQQFENSDFVGLAYKNSRGAVQTKLINISGFNDAYREALSLLP